MSGSDDAFCSSFKLGGSVTWVVFGGTAQRIYYSLIVDPLFCLTVGASSPTSNNFINFSLNQFVLFTPMRLKEASNHGGNGNCVFIVSWDTRFLENEILV